jgi:hypothetical protein
MCELTSRIGENMSVRSAFGAAYERHGVLVIPVALVAGGGGGGQGPMPTTGQGAPALPTGAGGGSATEDQAGGGGFGGPIMSIGAYVAKGRSRPVGSGGERHYDRSRQSWDDPRAGAPVDAQTARVIGAVTGVGGHRPHRDSRRLPAMVSGGQPAGAMLSPLGVMQMTGSAPLGDSPHGADFVNAATTSPRVVAAYGAEGWPNQAR